MIFAPVSTVMPLPCTSSPLSSFWMSSAKFRLPLPVAKLRKSSSVTESVERMRFAVLISAVPITVIPFGFTRSSGFLPVCFSTPASDDISLPVTLFRSAPFAVLTFSVSPLPMEKASQFMMDAPLGVSVPPLATVPPVRPSTVPCAMVPPVGIANAVDALSARQMAAVSAFVPRCFPNLFFPMIFTPVTCDRHIRFRHHQKLMLSDIFQRL